MAYFSNGSEGVYYMEKFCNKCAHQSANLNDGCCPVLTLHLMWNYETADRENLDNASRVKHDALNVLWPCDGIHNGDCKMFVKRKGSDERKGG